MQVPAIPAGMHPRSTDSTTSLTASLTMNLAGQMIDPKYYETGQHDGLRCRLHGIEPI